MKIIIILMIALCGCSNFGKGIISVDPEIAVLKGNVGKVLEANANLEARLDANVDALTGINNKLSKIENTAGRDVISTTNDSDLILSLFKTLCGVLTTVIASLFAFMRLQNKSNLKQLAAKDLYIENLRKSNEIKDAKAEEWQQKYIERLTKV